MRTFNERREEIFARAKKRIDERKRRVSAVNRVALCALPVAIFIALYPAVGSAPVTPDSPPSPGLILGGMPTSDETPDTEPSNGIFGPTKENPPSEVSIDNISRGGTAYFVNHEKVDQLYFLINEAIRSPQDEYVETNAPSVGGSEDVNAPSSPSSPETMEPPGRPSSPSTPNNNAPVTSGSDTQAFEITFTDNDGNSVKYLLYENNLIALEDGGAVYVLSDSYYDALLSLINWHN